MEKYVLFGAGQIGRMALKQLGRNQVAYFIDNSPSDTCVDGVPVYSYAEGIEHRRSEKIVVTVSEKYKNEISEQLEESGIEDVCSLKDALLEITRKKIAGRTDFIAVYNKSIEWIKNNTVTEKGIICNSDLCKPYPEVSGYYIPTLLEWGYRELAIQYAKWLCSIQKEDGSWRDTEDKLPYVFDTGQILKGLLAIREIIPEVDSHIIKGCDWLIKNIEEDGRFHQADDRDWDDNFGFSSELIHLYCLSPLFEAARIFDCGKYREAAKLAKNYFILNCRDEILDFRLLSHFYAYVMEALVDLGEEELAIEAMTNIKKYQKEDGSVPGLFNVNWVCSTGLFQLALVWYRLGEFVCGDKAFNYACKLQNESGGWYGGYLHQDYSDELVSYFPTQEISWVVKYFLDALTWKNKCLFDKQAPTFQIKYEDTDGRVNLIMRQVSQLEKNNNEALNICDVGCGKGAYLKILKDKYPKHHYFGVDISEKVMTYLDTSVAKTCVGSLTKIPFKDDEFDMVYACESLEHAVDIKSAIREMVRVIKPGGYIVILDKDKSQLGRMEIEEWEQWFDREELRQIMLDFCSYVYVEDNVPYEDKADNLFCGWIGKKYYK